MANPQIICGLISLALALFSQNRTLSSWWQHHPDQFVVCATCRLVSANLGFPFHWGGYSQISTCSEECGKLLKLKMLFLCYFWVVCNFRELQRITCQRVMRNSIPQSFWNRQFLWLCLWETRPMFCHTVCIICKISIIPKIGFHYGKFAKFFILLNGLYGIKSDWFMIYHVCRFSYFQLETLV